MSRTALIDLLERKAYLYDDESQGRRFHQEDIPADLVETVKGYGYRLKPAEDLDGGRVVAVDRGAGGVAFRGGAGHAWVLVAI